MRRIVDSNAMRLIEEKAIASGTSVETLMDIVAQQIADHIYTFAKKNSFIPPVLLLCGKGNNGADAYTTGSFLLQKNITCFAMQVTEAKEHSLLQARKKLFVDRGGKIVTYDTLHNLPSSLIIVDGIYGAGFKGAPDQASTKAILFANAHGGLIISIDIPSGVDPSNGECRGEAIFADYTVACQYPKKGCFLQAGFDHCGKMLIASMPVEDQATDMSLIEEIDLFSLMPRIKRTIDKFDAGVVTGISGSPGMLGATTLSAKGAFSVGAGYVHLLLPESVKDESSMLPIEAVKHFILNDPSACEKYLSSTTVFIGPGLGRTDEVKKNLEILWKHLPPSTVIDADALHFLSEKPMKDWHIEGKIITPHKHEAAKLFRTNTSSIDSQLLSSLHQISAITNATIVLKGAPTFIISTGHPTIVMPFGNPGMATAGSGDVATGMIAGFLAKKISPLSAAILGTSIHGIAGEEAACIESSYAVTASSIVNSIPKAFYKIIHLFSQNPSRSYLPYGRSS